MYFYIIASLTFLLVSGCCQDARLTWESFPFFDRGRVVFSAKDDHFFNLKSERISGTGDYIRGAIVLPSVGGDENVQQTAANNGVIIANGGPDRDQFLQLQLGNDEPSVPPWVMWRYARALGIDEPSVPPCAKWRGIKALGNDEPSAPPWGVIVADKGADRDVPGNDEPSAPPWVTWRCVRGFGGRDVGLSWRFQQNKFVAPPWLMIFVFSMPKKGVHARSPADETTRVGPPFGRRSVLGYDQSGHIPYANQNDSEVQEVILGWREQRSNTGHKETSGSVPGFGPLIPAKLAGLTAKLADFGVRPGMSGVVSRVNRRVTRRLPRTWYSRARNQHTATNERGPRGFGDKGRLLVRYRRLYKLRRYVGQYGASEPF